MPCCGHNVSLWVGGLDVKADFVPKINIVGSVHIALLDGREFLFLKIIYYSSGAGISMAVSSGAAAAGPGQDPISAHAAHLNLPPSASPPSADHPCGSALLTAWPREVHF